MRRFICIIIWTIAYAGLVHCSLSAVYAMPLGGPENVLVVQNSSSPMSGRIASYYITRRGIPSANLATINTQDSSLSSSSEIISEQLYKTQIEQPIKSYLSSHALTDKIQYIVLTKGIPHRISNGYSVDSTLASLNLIDPILVQASDQNGNIIIKTYANRYWRATEPFKHSRYGGYLVTRLDGYTEANAKALVDHAMAPQSVPYHFLLDIDLRRAIADVNVQPKSLILPDGSLNQNYSLSYSDFNADMLRAWQILFDRPHISVEINQTNAFIGSLHQLTGYVSWGSNDGGYSASVYNSLTFAPGAVAETAVSTSGRTMLPTTGGQSLIADLIAQGSSGGKGYVTEPYLDSMASPTVLFDLYSTGRNLAESYYAASRFVWWKDVVLGDPLCCLTGNTVTTLSQAKDMPDGSLVSFSSKVVTAGTDDFGNRFYIEEPDRSSGIQVYLARNFQGISEGMTVSVRGILSTRNGERVITNAGVVISDQ